MKNKQAVSFRYIVVKIILVTVFLLLAAVILVPFAAEHQFSAAQKLTSAYLWQEADVKFREAVALNPFDASHLAGYADFLRSTASAQNDRVSLLRQAEKLYERALKFDPLNAQYCARIGAIKLALFLKDKEKYRIELTSGLDYFKRAFENEPQGFNISYDVGYKGMGVWSYLDAQSKELVADRLRYVLDQRPWYGKFIYPWAWENTNDFEALERITPQTAEGHADLLYFLEANNLYQFRRKAAGNLDFYMKKERPQEFLEQSRRKSEAVSAVKNEALSNFSPGAVVSAGDWHGKAAYSINEFEDGAMYWSGTMSALVSVSAGTVKLVIEAKGSPAGGIYPYMIVELDTEEVGETFVKSDEWKGYVFPVSTGPGVKVLSVTFCNDGGNAKEDRNLFIGEARIISDER